MISQATLYCLVWDTESETVVSTFSESLDLFVLLYAHRNKTLNQEKRIKGLTSRALQVTRKIVCSDCVCLFVCLFVCLVVGWLVCLLSCCFFFCICTGE